MKRLVLAAALLAPQIVFAHTLRIDGSIGVTLHADPDDMPLARKNTSMYVDIEDRAGDFDPAACDCAVTIMQGGDVLARHSFAMRSPAVRHVFANPGVYTVTVAGSPRTMGSFQPFRTSFELYVRPTVGPAPATDQNPLRRARPYVLLVSGIILLLLVLHPITITPRR